MKKIASLFLCLAFVVPAYCQLVYKGFVDKFPIELVAEIYSDGPVNAIYAYNNFDTPIPINGSLKKGVLTFYEKGASGANSAEMLFSAFNPRSKQITGVWKNLENGKELKLILNLQYEVGAPDAPDEYELLQQASFDTHYFRVKISQKDGVARLTAVKMYEKRTDEIEKAIEVDCTPIGINSVSLGDFNFDGHTDFSVFETSYAGANTSSLYFLYTPRGRDYFNSQFHGISLTFDAATKTIQETNSCCAGSKTTTAVYKVVENKMVLIEEHCFVWDESKQERVERPLAECN